MNNEFKKSKKGKDTVYTLESASGGATGAGAIASVSSPIGGIRRRGDNLIAQEGDKDTTVTVPVTQKPRQGPLKPQTGAGAHRDKKKEQKQGKEKHRKPFYEDHEVEMASGELQGIAKNAVKLLNLVRQYGERGDLAAWQQSKITKAADYLNSVLQNLDSKQNPLEDHSTVGGWGKGSYDSYAGTRHGRGVMELKEPSGTMFLKFRIKNLPNDDKMVYAYGGFGTTPKDITAGNAKIKPFGADDAADVIAKIRSILSDREFVGVEKIVLDIPNSLMGPLGKVVDYAERDERVDLYSGSGLEDEPDSRSGGKVIGIDPEGKRINREPAKAQVGGSSRGVASTGMVTVQGSRDGQQLIQALMSQGRLSRDTKVQGSNVTLRHDDYKKILDVLGNDRFQAMFRKVGSVAEAKPGWMLKQDPKLGAKVKAKTDLAKKRQAAYGDPSAGKSIEKNKEQGMAEGSLEEVDRRGFLKGLGAAAVAGAAGVSTKADAQEVTQWTKYATDLAVRTMSRIHQDTGYDLRNWLVTNVSNWVTDYCSRTNSYNAKNVIDYCNQQGLEASGLDKQNALVTAFLTNMKNRYQDFLSAYRAALTEKTQEYNKELQKSQNQKQEMGGLEGKDFDILVEALMLYALSKDYASDPSASFSQIHKDVSASIGRFIRTHNNKEYVNSIFAKVKNVLDNKIKPNKEVYLNEVNRAGRLAAQTIANLDKLSSSKEPEFKEEQGVAEGDPGAKYRVKSIGRDAKGDYYISPSTGKKVYKKANQGDHENPNTGEIKPKVKESNYGTGQESFTAEIRNPAYDPRIHKDPNSEPFATIEVEITYNVEEEHGQYSISLDSVVDTYTGQPVDINKLNYNQLEDMADNDYRKKLQRSRGQRDHDDFFEDTYLSALDSKLAEAVQAKPWSAADIRSGRGRHLEPGDFEKTSNTPIKPRPDLEKFRADRAAGRIPPAKPGGMLDRVRSTLPKEGWEDEAENFNKFVEYATNRLSSTPPGATRWAMAQKLSALETKEFGSELLGKNKITSTIDGILDNLKDKETSPNASLRPGHISTPFGSVANPDKPEIDTSWSVTPAGKEWLKMAEQELRDAITKGTDELYRVAVALSKDQSNKFGSNNKLITGEPLTHEIALIKNRITDELKAQYRQRAADDSDYDDTPVPDSMLDDLEELATTHPEKFKQAIEAFIKQETGIDIPDMTVNQLLEFVRDLKENPPEDFETAVTNWLKDTSKDKQSSDLYMSELATKVAEKLNPQADVGVWVKDFQRANPNKYHQFKNKTPQKKAQMAVAAHYAANEPSKKK